MSLNTDPELDALFDLNSSNTIHLTKDEEAIYDADMEKLLDPYHLGSTDQILFKKLPPDEKKEAKKKLREATLAGNWDEVEKLEKALYGKIL